MAFIVCKLVVPFNIGSDQTAFSQLKHKNTCEREFVQMVIDANIFPSLIEILSKAEFKTRKEAAWAITNATSGGSAEQVRFLVAQGCIAPLCDLLTVMDSKIVQVSLTGLENILRHGIHEAEAAGGTNPYAVMIEECYGESKMFAVIICQFTFVFLFIVLLLYDSTSLVFLLFTLLPSGQLFNC